MVKCLPMALAILYGSAAATLLVDRQGQESLAQPLTSIAPVLGEWKATQDATLSPEVISALDASSYLFRIYERNRRKASLFVAHYAKQRPGQNIHSPKNCMPGVGWEIQSAETVQVPVMDRSVDINLVRIEKGSQRLLVLYWYQSKRRTVANEYLGKMFMIWDAAVGRSGGDSLVRITCDDSPDGKRGAVALASAVVLQMQRCLGGGAQRAAF